MEYCVNIVPAWLNLLKMNVMKSLELPLMQKISKFSNFIRFGIECQLSRDRAGRISPRTPGEAPHGIISSGIGKVERDRSLQQLNTRET